VIGVSLGYLTQGFSGGADDLLFNGEFLPPREADRVEAAIAAGIARDHLWIDPGFGFAKLPQHNCELVAALDEFAGLGLPVLLGASRKSTLGHLTGREVDDREPESLAAGIVGALNGASVLRVHDPGPMRRALTVAQAMTRGGTG